MVASSNKARVGIAGCGAVSRLYYARAISELAREGVLECVAAFDPDSDAAAAFAAECASTKPISRFDDLLDQNLDLLIVASPPVHHVDQSVSALRRGTAVHCEKPVALDMEGADRLVDAAAQSGRPLFVGMIRRHLPAAQAIRELVASGALGKITSADVFEGGPFRWPVGSPAYFDPDARNGVLEDIGTHCLDLLGWWLGTPDEVHYADDALGGTAANCLIALRFGDCTGRVRISRDWRRPNRVVIRGERGWIKWEDNDGRRLEIGFHENGLATRIDLRKAEVSGAIPALGSLADDFYGAFRSQLRASATGINGPGSAVTLADALPTVRLVDECRAVRMPMNQPWLAVSGQ